MPRFLPLVLLMVAGAVALASTAPQPEKNPPTASVRERADRAIAARAILRKYCHECHGGNESRGTVAVMEHERLIEEGPNPVPFVVPGEVARSQIIQFIEDGSMPPGGKPRPSREEIELLKSWIADGATHFPASFDPDATLRLLLDDAARRPDDIEHVRYLSLAHLIRDDAPPPDLASAERDLFAALARCGVTEMPTPVDAARALYRLDTRQAGWSSREVFVKEGQGEGVHPLTPYDLLLLEYPFAEGLPAIHPLAKELERYLAGAKLARPVPLLRADWLTGILGPKSPLVDDLRSLTELHAELGGGKKLPCGPRPRAFGRLNPVPPLAKPESTRAILPLSSWYGGDCQPARPPFTLSATLVDADGKPITRVKPGESFYLKVSADRAVHFVLVMVWSDGQAVFQPTQANGFLEAKETHLRPPGGAGGGFSIADILTGEKEATEYFVLLASLKPLPKPVIVRSRHSRGPACEKMMRYPVHRFLLEGDATLDHASVVRRVIPVSVTARGD